VIQGNFFLQYISVMLIICCVLAIFWGSERISEQENINQHVRAPSHEIAPSVQTVREPAKAASFWTEELVLGQGPQFVVNDQLVQSIQEVASLHGLAAKFTFHRTVPGFDFDNLKEMAMAFDAYLSSQSGLLLQIEIASAVDERGTLVEFVQPSLLRG
jgi:hypothetical protein